MVRFKNFIAVIAIVFLGIACLAMPEQAVAAPKNNTVKISVDSNTINVGSSFNLYIDVETSKKLTIDTLDYQPLGTIFSVGYIEFKEGIGSTDAYKYSYKWKIPLISNTSGVIKVPELSFYGIADIKTPKFELKVLPAVKQTKKLIKAQLRNTHLIEGQMSLYRVEIDQDPNMRIENISPPSCANATIELFAERTISRARAGNQFHKTQIREYKIVFNKAGEVTIKAPTINGIVKTENKRSFIQKADDITLTIQPKKADGLVTENLTVTTKWTPNENEISVGTPITRTITMRGTNISLSQLPKISLPSLGENFDSFEESMQESEKIMRNSQFISTRVISQVFVPKKNHTKFEVPEQHITWVNPNDNSKHDAIVDGRKIEINGFSFNDYIPSDPKYTSYIVLALIFGILFIIFFIYSIIWYRNRVGIYGVLHQYRDNQKYWSKFCKGWTNNDPLKSRAALLEWAQKRFSTYTIVGLKDIPFYASIKEEVEKLSAACWSSDHAEKWKGNALFKLVKKNKNYKKPKAKMGINPYGLNGEIYETVTQKMK